MSGSVRVHVAVSVVLGWSDFDAEGLVSAFVYWCLAVAVSLVAVVAVDVAVAAIGFVLGGVVATVAVFVSAFAVYLCRYSIRFGFAWSG